MNIQLMINHQIRSLIHMVRTLELQLPRDCCHGNKCVEHAHSVHNMTCLHEN